MRHMRILLPLAATVAAIVGYLVYCAPEKFDAADWRESVAAARSSIQEDLRAAMLTETDVLTPEKETQFARHLEAGAARLHALGIQLETVSDIEPTDRATASDLRLLERAVLVVERLHRSRAAIADAERRTTVAGFQTPNSGSAETSPNETLTEFWQVHRPWIGSELASLRLMTEPSSESGIVTTHAFQTFIVALDVDLERVTQAALAVEVRRVDLWLDWASRQPSSRLPSMKQIAIEQVSHLENLAATTRELNLPPDPRISTLHRDLRRMASVSSPRNWE